MAGADNSDSTPKRQSDSRTELKSGSEEQVRDALAGFATVLVSFFAGVLFGSYLAFSDPRAAEWLLSGWYVYLIVTISVVLGTAIILGYRYWENRHE